MRDENGEIGARRFALTRTIAELLFELVERLLDLVLCHQVAAVMAHLREIL